MPNQLAQQLLNQRLRDGAYTFKGPRGKRGSPERVVFYTETLNLMRALQRDLEATYEGSNLPSHVLAPLFESAWERGQKLGRGDMPAMVADLYRADRMYQQAVRGGLR